METTCGSRTGHPAWLPTDSSDTVLITIVSYHIIPNQTKPHSAIVYRVKDQSDRKTTYRKKVRKATTRKTDYPNAPTDIPTTGLCLLPCNRHCGWDHPGHCPSLSVHNYHRKRQAQSRPTQKHKKKHTYLHTRTRLLMYFPVHNELVPPTLFLFVSVISIHIQYTTHSTEQRQKERQRHYHSRC